MTDLPHGWEWATLEDLAGPMARAITDGPFGSNLKSEHYTQNGARVIRLQNIGDGHFRDERTYISLERFEALQTHEVRTGDIVVASLGDTPPRACLVPTLADPAIVKADCIRVRLSPRVDSRWILHTLTSPQTKKFAANLIRGVGRPRLGLSQIRALRVPVPPLAEQRRIVNALDFYLPRLQSATTSLRSAWAKADLLVATARHDATMAANDTQPLGDLLVEIEAGKSFAAEGRPAEADEWGIIKVSAMTWGEFRQDENKAVPCDREIDIHHEIRPGDILISRANTEKYVGAPVLVRDTRPKLLLSDKSLRLVPKQSVDPMWLIEVLASPAVRSQISARATGMKDSMRNISQKALREIRVPHATPEQQARAVEALSSLRVETSRLRSQVYATERRQDILRASLLRDAFAGRLEPQDPNDQPASVILERIKAERAAQPTSKRERRNTKGSNPDWERML